MALWHGLPILIGTFGALLFFHDVGDLVGSSSLLFCLLAGLVGLLLVLAYFLRSVSKSTTSDMEEESWI
jgi:hypothetical protein